jgi:hypothetical protein
MMFTRRGLILFLGIVGFVVGGGIGIAVAALQYWSSFSISVAARAAVIGGLMFAVVGVLSGGAVFHYLTEIRPNKRPT